MFLAAGAEDDLRRLGSNFSLGGWIFSGTALFGLLIAVVGIYGALANLVVQRTREFGIRLALGAQTKDIRRLVLGQASYYVASGVIVGLAGAWVLGRVLDATMPDVFRQEPLVLLGVAILTGGVALLACWQPVRRAAKIDAIMALRAE